MPDFESLQTLILHRLETELPEVLTYHTAGHTRDVIAASERIAKSEGIAESDILNLKTAAVLHDSGFLNVFEEHEEESCQIGRSLLPDYGFSEAAIQEIMKAIMATRIPQTPTNLLGRILADADLDYLGREDFYPIGETLFQEFLNRNIVQDEEGWNRLQVRFLEGHDYFTTTNLRERKPQKLLYLTELKKRLEAY